MVKAGIIGCGFVATRAHIPVYRALGVDIAAVCDQNESRARSCARKFRVKRWFTDADRLLREELDLVSVCTPPSTHAKVAIACARAGKHVLVEKPMTTTVQDADRLLGAVKDAGVKLCVVHNYRFFPAVVDTERRVSEGRIGRIVALEAVGHDFAPMSISQSLFYYTKWGLLEDLGSHFLDIINFLVKSRVVKTDGIALDYTGSMNSLNHILTTMVFESKASAVLDLSWVTGYEMSLKVWGTAGSLVVDVRNNQVQEVHGFSTPLEDLSASAQKLFKTMKSSLKGTYFKGALYYHRDVIRRFIESIERDIPPPVTGEEGRATVAMIDQIQRNVSIMRVEKGTGISEVP